MCRIGKTWWDVLGNPLPAGGGGQVGPKPQGVGVKLGQFGRYMMAACMDLVCVHLCADPPRSAALEPQTSLPVQSLQDSRGLF